ncbi:MAG: 3-oxoacyl-ACP reductase [Thermoleophilaceae bacterium]
MSDLFTRIANAPVGSQVVSRLGLPRPVELDRGASLRAPVLLGGDGRLAEPLAQVLRDAGAELAGAGADGCGALVFDASGIEDSTGLRGLYDFFHPVIRSLRPCGRVIVLGAPPERPRQATAQRALEGFVRSLGKEVGKGSTANLVYAAEGAPLESTLRFFLSGRSAYVSGQVVRVESAEPGGSLDGKVAVVTGAARGIGEAIAETLARDGAHVVCADVPAQGEALAEVANRVGGAALALDVTAADAPERLATYLRERHGGVDAVVHNAGITRDRTLGRMTPEEWDVLLDVNLSSQERIDDALLGGDVLRSGGSIVGVSSMSGIAGNRGQSNYATSKAGVIGRAESMAPVLRERGGTINAVAPGFIETAMTAQMPLATREAGRRMSSLAQGGLPVDVAETIAWLAAPASRGVNGNAIRVCGQNLLGA